MKLRSNWILALLVFAAMCVCGWSAFGQRQSTDSMRWEYSVKLVTGYPEDSPSLFSELGEQGWELIAVSDGRAYFKRPKK